MRVSLLFLAAVGCGTNAMTTPPDMTPVTVTCKATVTPPAPTLIDSKTMAKTPANMACLGTRVDPAAPTMDTVVMGNVKDFQDSNVVVGAVVSIYSDATQVPDHPIAMSSPTAKDGTFMITVPKGFYRVIFGNSGGKAVSSGNAMTDTIPTYEFAQIYNSTDRVSVKTTTRDAIPGLVSVTPDVTLGVVAGSVRDCDNKQYQGGLVTVTAGTWEANDQCLMFYFKDIGGSTLPVRTQKYTDGNGVWAALNVPPGMATIQANGLINGMVGPVGSATIPIISGAITTVDIAPAGPAH